MGRSSLQKMQPRKADLVMSRLDLKRTHPHLSNMKNVVFLQAAAYVDGAKIHFKFILVPLIVFLAMRLLLLYEFH